MIRKLLTLNFFLLLTVFLVGLVVPISSQADEVVVFGPKVFARSKGAPVAEVVSFNMPVARDGILRVYNGSEDDQETGERVSSSVLNLNAITIVRPNQFNQNVHMVEAPVSLRQGSNSFGAVLKSKPGGQIVVRIIVLNAPPVAAFSANPPEGSAPHSVSFDATTSTDPDDSIVSYSWDFGDTGTGTGITTSHTYAAPGNYTATLTVTDSFGASDQTTVPIVVTQANLPPTANFTATPTTGTAPLLVSFDATSSTDDFGIATYAWDFGDGNMGSGVTTNHSYINPGTFDAILTVTDTLGLTDQTTVQIQVNGLPPGVNAFSGRILDTTDFTNGGIETPIVGVEVSLFGTNFTTTSDINGRFTLTGIPSGDQILDMNAQVASNAPDGSAYASFREKIEINEGANNIARPFFLPRISAESVTPVIPSQETVVTNPTIGVSLTIPPFAAKNPDGTDFIGQLSISPVPEALAPAALPKEFGPGLLITIQPVGVVFDPPAPVTFPNTDGLPPGAQIEIRSLDPASGTFISVGIGQVSADGSQVETIFGGVRASTWHFITPPPAPASPPGNSGPPSCTKPCCGGGGSGGPPSIVDSGSHTAICSGNLSEEHFLVSYTSNNQSRGLSLVYNNTNADPQPIISQSLLSRAGGAELFNSVALEFNGGVASEQFYNTIPPGLNQLVRYSKQIDASNLETGVYPYSLTIKTKFTRSSSAVTLTERNLSGAVIPVNNQSQSIFGAGWTLDEVDKLLVQADGSALLIEGDGRSIIFGPEFRESKFTTEITTETALFAGGNRMETGDLNNDGFLDLVLPSEGCCSPGTVSIFLGDGTGQFLLHGELILEKAAFGVNIADFNEDGFLDLTFPDTFGNLGDPDSVSIYFGNGTGDFAAPVNIFLGFVATSLIAGDMNNDGHVDLIAGLSSGSKGVEVIFGDGAGNFSAPVNTPNLVSSPVLMEVGKFDDNDFPDLVIHQGTNIVILLGDGRGRFLRREIDESLSGFVFNMAVADFNNDGFSDVVAHTKNTATDAAIFLSDGRGGLLAPFVFATGNKQLNRTRLAVDDFNEDGNVDLAITNTKGSGNVSIFLGDGAGRVSPSQILNGGFGQPVKGDFNNDGSIDLAYRGGSPLGIHVQLATPPSLLEIFQSPPGEFSILRENTDGTFTRTMKDGTQFIFDAQGLQTSMVDRNGNTNVYAYDAIDQLETITDPQGLITTFVYSGNLLQSVTDPAGRVTQLQHDINGDLTRVTDPDGSFRQFSYDSRHRLVSQTSKRGFVTTYDYNFAGRNVQANRPDGSIVQIQPRDTFGLIDPSSGLGTLANPATFVLVEDVVPTYTDANGGVTEYVYNDLGILSGTKDPLGRLTLGETDLNGNFNKNTLPNGAVVSSSFDDKGNLLKNTEESILATTTFTYEPNFNQVTSITDPNGNSTSGNYDPNGNLIELIDAVGTKTVFAYADLNCPGQVTSITRAQGLPEENTSTNVYDPTSCNRLQSIDPLGNATAFEYDTAGNVTQSTDAKGRETRFEFDAMGRVTKAIDPTNALSSPPCGTAGVTCFNYDVNGNLADLVDANGNTTAFEYDERDRVVRRTDPLLNDQTFVYDGNGNRRFSTDRNGQIIEFQYDAANQLVNKILLPGTPEEEVITLDYDLLGTPTSIVDADSALSFTSDPVGRLTSESTTGSPNQPDVTLNHTYDLNGNRLTMNDGSGATGYVYDVLNRLTSITNPSLKAVGFDFDPLSRRTKTTFSNGITTDFNYDLASQLTGLANDLGATNVSSFNYTYDPVGNRDTLATARPIAGAATNLTYIYDPLDQVVQATRPLTGDPDETFVLDPVGNRLQRDGQVVNSIFDAINRLQEDASFNYSYDNNGNLTSRTDKSTGEITQYIYDPENRMIQLQERPNLVDPPTKIVNYRYDGLGRRIQKDVDGVITTYVYDGEDILLEFDGANVQQARYTHGPGIDEPLIMDRGGASFFYHTEGLGSVTELTDAAGLVAQAYIYDAFGGVQSTDPLINPYAFTGREFDSESGLYFYRARYYDPNSGRFMSEDPIGFAGEDINLYRYVGNNPINGTDPLGTLEPTIILLEATLAFCLANPSTCQFRFNTDCNPCVEKCTTLESGLAKIREQIRRLKEEIRKRENKRRQIPENIGQILDDSGPVFGPGNRR